MEFSGNDLVALRNFYRDQLLSNTIPFWFPRSVDEEFGGFLLIREADGSLLDDDKAGWIQGRATWLLSTLFNTVERKTEWLQWAKSGLDFFWTGTVLIPMDKCSFTSQETASPSGSAGIFSQKRFT